MSIWKRLFENNAKRFWESFSNSKAKQEADPYIDTDFAASVVALAAKMAAADGEVTNNETLAFRAAFPISPQDEESFERLFHLAKSSVLGYDGYAKKIGKKYRLNKQILIDVLSVLFFVAAADGLIRKVEEDFLEKVSTHFGLTKSEYSRISANYFADKELDPYHALGVHESDTDETIRAAWLAIVSKNHPDNFVGRGEPIEFVRLANINTANANNAYAKIKAERQAQKAEV